MIKQALELDEIEITVSDILKVPVSFTEFFSMYRSSDKFLRSGNYFQINTHNVLFELGMNGLRGNTYTKDQEIANSNTAIHWENMLNLTAMDEGS